jgi:hypothetical protein
MLGSSFEDNEAMAPVGDEAITGAQRSCGKHVEKEENITFLPHDGTHDDDRETM